MKIRPYSEEKDGEDIRSLYERSEQSFPLPNLNLPLFVRKIVAKTDDRVIALGLIKLTCEAILILDSNLYRVVRAKAVSELILTAIIECQKLGIDEIHAFLTGDCAAEMQTLLKKHHGFEDCVGIPLVLRI